MEAKGCRQRNWTEGSHLTAQAPSKNENNKGNPLGTLPAPSRRGVWRGLPSGGTASSGRRRGPFRVPSPLGFGGPPSASAAPVFPTTSLGRLAGVTLDGLKSASSPAQGHRSRPKQASYPCMHFHLSVAGLQLQTRLMYQFNTSHLRPLSCSYVFFF